MTLGKKLSIGFSHRPSSIGGSGSFQVRLSLALEKKGWRIVYPDSGIIPDIVLVIGGTVKLHWLWKCKARGAKIIHRLDGIYWYHRVTPAAFSGRERIEAEVRNWLTRLIRRFFANHIIYQSEFIRDLWHTRFGPIRHKENVIYNAVNLSTFSFREDLKDNEKPRLLCVEGKVQSNAATIEPLKYLSQRLYESGLISQTVVCGDIDNATARQLKKIESLSLLGEVPRDKMCEVYRNAVYLVLEVNPPCPNSVIEALASGIPVIGFDTGALRELVSPEAGILVPYDGDPWKLEVPNVSALERAACQVLEQWHSFSKGARVVAEKRFGLDRMVDSYLEVFEKAVQTEEHSDENCN